MAWTELLFAQPASQPPLFHEVPATDSGVTMQHPLLPDHSKAYLYVSGFASGGVCIGDVNGDDRLDLFFTSGPEANRLYLQTDEPLKFRDATTEANLTGRAVDGTDPWAAGAAMADVNHDGQLDIYVCNYDAPNQLFINEGDGRFSEQAHEWRLDIVDASMFPAFMDVDGSGELALYLMTNRYERPGGRPPNPPVVAIDGVLQIAPGFEKYYHLKPAGPGRFDVDFTGRPDRLLVVQRDANGQRRYRDASKEAGLVATGAHGLSATWFDYDSDARPDLYVCNDFADADWFYHNEGRGEGGVVRLKNVIADVAPVTTWSSMGADAGDINNDGLMDFVAGDMASRSHFAEMINMGDHADRDAALLSSWPRQLKRNMVFLNTGVGRFLEAAWLTGLAQTDWTWAVKLADFDNDGRLDALFTNGTTRNYTDADLPFTTDMYVGHTDWDLLRDQPPRKEANLAFRNVDGLRFENTSRAWGLDHLGMSYAAACGDLDSDGDLDLVVCNLEEPVSIYRNDCPPQRHWLRVRLAGKASHPQGWGSVVRVKTASGWQMRQMNPATGFLSCNDPTLHFGLGDDAIVEAIEVRWPSGRWQRVGETATNQRIVLTEPNGDDPVDTAPVASAKTLFERATFSGLEFRHRERPFDDYEREPLLPGKLSQLGPGVAVGDANADGFDDVYVGGAAGQAGVLFVNNGDGAFTRAPGPWDDDAACEDMGAVWFDADGDARLDLFVVSGGVEGFEGDDVFQDRLYLNRTQPGLRDPAFVKAPVGALPDLRHSGSAACAADYDGDGDLDLFVGSRSIPGRYPQTPRSTLLRNDSSAREVRFADATDEAAPGLAEAGLVTGAVWSDVDADGALDLLVVSEWGPVKVWHNRDGALIEQTTEAGLAGRTGWWNGIAPGDFNGDARIDYLVTNVGLNTKYGAPRQGRSSSLFAGDVDGRGGFHLVEARPGPQGLLPVRGLSASAAAMPLLAHKFATHRAYGKAPLRAIYDEAALLKCQRLSTNEFRTGLLLNRSEPGKLAFEWQPLPDIVQISAGFGAAIGDFNSDGYTDAVIAQNLFTRESGTGPWRGGLSQLLLGAEDGLTPAPARESGITLPGDAKGATTLDANGDARPDVLVAQNDDSLASLANRSDAPALALRIVRSDGTPAIGARVTLHFSDGRTSVAELNAGSGYLSQSAPEIFIGAGDAGLVRAEVRWPARETGVVELSGKSGRQVISP
jgi:hypothetical protein